ncbi:ribosome-associated translation inhibitor RaiA [Candidatus Wolfebacteria bacterium]|nr:ribosome-associated translation inhibitor RaiA [Candidatus Wolfebacteria bacterium]
MKIIIKASQLDLTPAIYEYIETKIGSLDKFVKKFETKSDIKTEVGIARSTKHHRHGNVFFAEANIHLPKKILRAEHYDINIRIAIDNIKKKLHQEILKYKDAHFSAPLRRVKKTSRKTSR